MLLQLPVKPYTLKFLTRHLGTGYKLTTVDAYGLHLYGLLRQPRTDRHYDKFLRRYTAKFPVNIVPHLVADRACKNCSSLTIINFNSFAEGVFYTEFHQFVEVRVELGVMQAKQAIELFCERFGLSEDDINYETLKRNWQRYKKRQQKREEKRLEMLKSPSSLSPEFRLAA